MIIGTAAVKSPGFLHDACDAFPGQVIVGLDARDGKVATDGWSKLTRHEVVDLARKFEGYGIEGIIYTDIGRDGMMTGVNIDATVRLAQAVGVPVFASGGAGSLEDIDRLLAVESEGRRRGDPRALALRGNARFRRGPRAGRAANDRRRAGGSDRSGTTPRRLPADLTKRIIPCLDVTAGRVVKGVNFVALRDAGDPVEIAAPL